MTVGEIFGKPVLGWAQRNRVLGWFLFLVVAVVMTVHIGNERDVWARQDRKITAIQTLLCYVVDTTRRSVAEACQDMTHRPDVAGVVRIDSAKIPAGILAEALSAVADGGPR